MTKQHSTNYLRAVAFLAAYVFFAHIAQGQSAAQTARNEGIRSVRVIHAFEGDIRELLISGDSGTLAVLDEARQIKLISPVGAFGSYSLPAQPADIRAMALSNDGKLLLTSADDDRLRLWDIIGRSERAKIRMNLCYSVAIAPNQASFAARARNLVRIGDMNTLKTGMDYPIKGGARMLVLSKDGDTLAIENYGDRMSLCFVDTLTGRHRIVDRAHGRILSGARFLKHGLFATASQDHHLKVWEVATGELKRDMHEHFGDGCLDRIYALGYDEVRSHLYTFAFDHEIRIWDLTGGQLVRKLPLNLEGHRTSLIGAAAFSLDNRYLFVGTYAGRVLVFDLKNLLEARSEP